MNEKHRRNVEKKIIQNDPTDKALGPGPCLGPDGCDKIIERTMKIRLCSYCRQKVTEIEGESGVYTEPAKVGEE